ncbi:DUF1460 domain-containing protein [Nocardia africana]|uniref:DUF1460 domain-containing protein n=1 Tax=Nocardia africana TaxID=134964 RepID=UPI0007A55D2E|nr:DUF1460 domain-containing protein [Nocardia africana]MCC3311877.1 DUF1460 domain-containing protein [Nocardia africana]
MRSTARTLPILLVLFATALLLPVRAGADAAIDDTTSHRIDELVALRAGATGASKGELLDLLSRQFLGTPYAANTLIGSPTQPEQLVADFRQVDCFTFLDYVEALSRTADRNRFEANLIDTRYAEAQVDYTHRKHFFTDWARVADVAATDMTALLSPAAITVPKHLNARADGGVYLPGIPVVDRNITYIRSAAVDQGVINGLRTGDYIGAYADQPGLDVTHVGILVMTPSGPVFRNASSLATNNKVVDTPLGEYVQTVPGIVVLRPRSA